jgi:hypothetical protein
MAYIATRTTELKLAAHQQFKGPNKRELQEIQRLKADKRQYKFLPNNLLKTLQVAYSKKYSTCDTLLTSTHLKEHHTFRYSINELLDILQNKKLRRSAKRDLKRYATLLQGLAKHN